MFGKKSDSLAQKPSVSTEESIGLWQSLNRKTFDFLSETRVELRTLPLFNLAHLLNHAIKSSTTQSLKESLEKLFAGFEQARGDEVKHLNHYILGLRGLFWSSLNEIQDQRGHVHQESMKMEALREKMVTALDSDDLMQLKVVVKDWVVLQNQMDLERKKQMQESEANFRRQLSRLQNELYQTQTELKLDGLTQVYNRKAFDSEIKKALQIAQLSGNSSTLMLFDIDHFKNVNDTYGHPIGDKVLQHFAKMIVQNFPTRTDFVARYGGEEFVVLMSDCDLTEAKEKAKKFVGQVRKETMIFGPVSLKITVSIGVASSSPFGSVDDWIKRTDVLLYQAKEEGRDCFIIDGSAA